MTSRLILAQPAEYRDAVAAALAGPAVHMAALLLLDFADGAFALSNRNLPFTDLRDGRSWRPGAGLLVGFPDMLDGGETELAPWRRYQIGLPFDALDLPDGSSLSGYMTALVAYCGNPALYRNRVAETALQLFDPETGAPVGWPIVLDRGLMDDMQVSRLPQGVVVGLTVESLLSRKGVPVYGMQTYRDQQRRYPGDEGFQFTSESSRLVNWTNW